MKEPEKKLIRPAIVNGLFYPEEPEELQALITEKTASCKRGNAPVILSPHASWESAGTCMAAAFSAAAEREPETVLLIGPVHREADKPALYLPEKKYFETPFGAVPVAVGERDRLKESCSLFRIDDIPHMEEHCLEVQLPFIRHFFPRAQILPVLTGRLNRKQIRRAAAELKSLYYTGKKSTLTVLSVNLSSFDLLETSQKAAERLTGSLNFPLAVSLPEEEKAGRITTCGTVPLTLVSDALDRAMEAETVVRTHSRVTDRESGKGVYYGGIYWKEADL